MTFQRTASRVLLWRSPYAGLCALAYHFLLHPAGALDAEALYEGHAVRHLRAEVLLQTGGADDVTARADERLHGHGAVR
jgi:hypothetical protein